MAFYLQENLNFMCFQVVARAQNGGGEISVTLTPPYGVNLCIGKSVEILLKKEARKLTLTVDGHTPVTASRPGASSADTKSPIFFGGVPGKILFSFVRIHSNV